MNGLIAYFDILGYQSFLQNNSASATAETVLELITHLPQQVKGVVSKSYQELESNKEVAKQISDSVRHLIFSDTILLSIEYPANVSNPWKNDALLLLSAMANLLCANMFEKGLPLRGAIVEGEFITKEYCFAGKAIVDAYNISQTLDLSGIVFDTRLSARIRNLFSTTVRPQYMVHYLTPLKGLKEEKKFHTNWLLCYTNEEKQIILSDIEQFVLRSFWAHNKDCPQHVESKVANTSKLIRRFAIALENP
jgi:hypothetical protein